MPKQAKNQTLKNAHGGYAGRTLIERIQAQMDKRRKMLEAKRIQQGVASKPNGNTKYETALYEQALEQGRYEGFAATLAILRSSSLTHEIERSNERLGIE